jgi:hypothetical protein
MTANNEQRTLNNELKKPLFFDCGLVQVRFERKFPKTGPPPVEAFYEQTNHIKTHPAYSLANG